MGWVDRWARRLFVAFLVVLVGSSLSWIAAPVAGRLIHSAPGGGGPTGVSADPSTKAGLDAGRSAGAGATGSSEAISGSGSDEAAPGPTATQDVAEPTADQNAAGLALPAAAGYVWPIKGAKLTTYFVATASGTMMLGDQAVHDGVDLARPCGWPIGAAHAGTVLYAGRRADPYLGFSGPMQPYYDELARRKLNDSVLPIMVVIDDGNGLIGVYAHLGKAIVKGGQAVRAGQTIGYEGATGNATGCHLHYGLYLADGPWVRVAWNLVTKWHYPVWMRLRIDPLLYLPADSPDAARPRADLTPPADPPRYLAPTPDLPLEAAY